MWPYLRVPACAVYLLFLPSATAQNGPSGNLLPQKALEICDNQLDDDGDGYVDCYDSECPCFNGADCSVTDLPSEFRARLAWQSEQNDPSVTAIPVVANMNPQQDSMPEIIVAAASPGGSSIPNRILFFRGDGSNRNSPFVLTVPSGFDGYPVPGPTVGDINQDGVPELIMSCRDRRIRVFRNYSETPGAPMALWVTSTGLLDFLDQKPYLADFNGDGIAEIYAGSDVFQFDFSIPNAPVLNKVINGSGFIGRAAYNNYLEGSCSPTAVDLLSIADCNGDPDCAGLELAAGPLIYSIDLNTADGDGYQIKIQRDLNQIAPGNSFNDGYTAVADVDLDGVPDIVVSGLRGNFQMGVYVWNKNAFLRFMPYPGGNTRSGSLACIANLFDDRTAGFATDMPEILVCNAYNLNCFNLQAAQTDPAKPYWWSLVTKDYSGFTGSSVYDFNGDGIFEVVYRDEDNFRILYGGAAPFPSNVDAERNWFKIPCGSLTADEYPIVADVDNDGETEIAVTGYTFSGYNSPSTDYRGRLRIFESDADPWVPCRNVWNQFNYFVVNVNDDLSIPAQQQQHHVELPLPGSGNRPINRYLSQRPLLNENFEPFLPVPDALAMQQEVHCADDSVEIQVQICNAGSKTLKAGTPVAFYRTDPRSTAAELIGIAPITGAEVKIDSCGIFKFKIPAATGTIFGIVNDDGSHPRPLDLATDFPVTNQPECNWLNNIFQFDFLPSAAPVGLGADVHSCADTALVLRAGSGHSSYRWQDGSVDSVFHATAPGWYWVDVYDQCIGNQVDSLLVEVYGFPQIQIDTVNGDCAGNPGSAHVVIGSGYAPFEIKWSTDDVKQMITNIPDGMYGVTVTDAKGCVAVDSTWVEAGGLVQLDYAVAPIACFGETGAINVTVVTGTAPVEFLWSNSAGTAGVQDIPAGNYSVTASDADGCSQTLFITLPQPDALKSAGIAVQAACPGEPNGSLTFQGASGGTAPYSVTWSTGDNTPDLTGLPASIYTLTLTDANGCSLVEQAQVTEFVPPTLDAGVSDISCFGQNNGSVTVAVLNGSPGFGYAWSNTETTPQIQSLAPGNYALTLTYADGSCSKVFDFQINEPPDISLNATVQHPLCAGSTDGGIQLNAAGGTPPLAFQWPGGMTTQNLAALHAGVFTVTVTDAHACSAILPVTLAEPDSLQIADIATVAACPGEANGAVTLTGISQGTPPYTLVWSNGQTDSNLNGLSAQTYTVSVTDAHGCTLEKSAEVPEFAAPVLETEVNPVTCFGKSNGSISTAIGGGSQGIGYAWSTGALTPGLQGLGPGVYSLTLTYANGKCAENFDFQIDEPPLLALVQADATPVRCFGETNGAVQIAAGGGVQPYTYQWSNGSSAEDVSNLAAGNYALTLTDGNGCTLTGSFSIVQPAPLALQQTVTADTCEAANGAIVVTPSGGMAPYAVKWSDGSSGPMLSGLAAGVYFISLTDANGCQDMYAAQVPAWGKIPVAISFTDTITCFDPVARIGVSANQQGLHYTWKGPAGSLPDKSQQDVQAAGTYSVLISNVFGCTTSAQIQVMQDTEVPVAEAGAATVEVPCNQTSLLLDASGSSVGAPYMNRWLAIRSGMVQFDTAALLISVQTGGLYIHTVLNSNNGCRAADSVLVHWADPVAGALTVDSITCFGEKDGAIRLKALAGGTPPYQYSIDNQQFYTTNLFINLAAGVYPVVVRDIYGCLWRDTVILPEPDSIAVRLIASDTVLELGQILRLEALPWPPDLELSGLVWQPLAGFEFLPMALIQTLRPEENTTFTVQIFDNRGCAASDRVSVRVDNYQIYVPNVIFPGTAANSYFTIFAGDGVTEIRQLQVFDRWGNWVFENRHFLPNIPESGWGGTFRDEPVNPGVFVWFAEIVLRDGRVRLLKGDVTVLR